MLARLRRVVFMDDARWNVYLTATFNIIVGLVLAWYYFDCTAKGELCVFPRLGLHPLSWSVLVITIGVASVIVMRVYRVKKAGLGLLVTPIIYAGFVVIVPGWFTKAVYLLLTILIARTYLQLSLRE